MITKIRIKFEVNRSPSKYVKTAASLKAKKKKSAIGFFSNDGPQNAHSDSHHDCQITVTDYSKSRYMIHGPFQNDDFLAFMDQPQPVWSKIRWINVNVTEIYRASEYQTTLREYHFPKSTYNRSVLQYGDTNSEVGIEQVSLFYTGSVVISIFEHSGEVIAHPILKRISAGSAMLLRNTEDIDLLIHAIVDGIVDNCEAVISSYQEHLAHLERGVLDNPRREHTRELHLFISELSLLRKTLAPVITIVNDFRNNLQNAVVAKAQFPPLTPGIGLQSEQNSNTDYFGSATNARSGYWADVADHIYANSDNIDSMRALSDNLINLIFNTLSSRQNDIMRSLTITTIVFLPLSTTAGYFGMNFTQFEALDESVWYFWKIAIPVTCFILLLAASPRLLQALKSIMRYAHADSRFSSPRRGASKWKIRRRRTSKKAKALDSIDSNDEG
ncbi:Putative uncharacterized protein [Taphrina deformans PYCC 5710]|uniref:CorA family metal ion transporter n=1 Tax=Taphrina deformans (strain PYCC 5710 / ATCC 11124 / CBS 356.35 / IMI 108563 / JCM 9778 / NBRC 8474) TaxID=1097556 RepID=R4XBF5_TAPDE|nr:Putative uncharacterized protein [Taphrina deformans PYCC 5710]|eukprot:CCG81701.1 Putative uncharacterized protein [Taphrina deformans PYCC 5710]